MAESLKSYLQMFIERDFTLKQGADLLNERIVRERFLTYDSQAV